MTVKALKKQLMAAIAMVVVSAIALSSSTYAWFATNAMVSAKEMSVTAQSETGIVIAAYSNQNGTAPTSAAFAATANANVAAGTEMLPTFTKDGAAWYHTNSTQSDNGQAYVATGYTDVTSDSEHVYYLMNKFQIKSAGGTNDVYVNNVEVVSGGAQAYDPSIRVLVKSGSTSLVFAPIEGAPASETISATTGAEDAVTADQTVTFVTPDTVGALLFDDLGTTPQDVLIYIYYDGEDPACKSDNIPDAFAATKLNVHFSTSVTPVEP